MKMRFPVRRFARITIPVVLSALVAIPLWAGEAAARPHQGPWFWMDRAAMHGPDGSIDRLLALADELSLTDAQKTKLREIRRSAPGALMSKNQAVAEARIDLRDLLEQKNTSSADLKRAHDKLIKAQGDLEAARFDLRMQLRDALTPEQRDKLRERTRNQMRERTRQRFGALDFDYDDGPPPPPEEGF